MLLSAWRVLNLGLLNLLAGTPAEPVLVPERVPLVFQAAGSRVSAKFIAPAGDRWVRLIGTGTVRINGTLVPLRPQDQATESVALTPFLRRGENLLDVEGYSGPGVLEITPRVFLTVRRQGETLSAILENTLANACNVEVTLGERSQNAYLPPEAMAVLDFSAPPPTVREIQLYKFAEALEESYTFRRILP